MDNNTSWSHWQRNVFGKRRRKFEEDSVDDLDTASNNQVTLDSLKFLVNTKWNRERAIHPDTKLAPIKNLNTPSTSRSTTKASDIIIDIPPSPKPAVAFTSAAQLAGIPADSIRASRSKQAAEPASKCSEEDALPDWQQRVLARNKDISAEHIARILSSMITPDRNQVRSSDIGGLADVKELIETCVIRPLKRPDLHLGLYKAASGVLLFGPPGTGKTTIAKWIATEASATFFCVTPSTFVSMYQGESETLIKCLFACATEIAPSIIFMDEIDGVIGKRSNKEEDSTLRMKNQLLQAMDGLQSSDRASIIVIGATNRPEAIDDAAIRRLPKRIYIPLPDSAAIATQIMNILVKHARDLQICSCRPTLDLASHACPVAKYDCEEVATTVVPRLAGFNGSDIRALCVKAAEIVYQRILAEYNNDIDRVPAPDVFRLPTPSDLLMAADFCRPSFNGDSDVLNQWAASFGSS